MSEDYETHDSGLRGTFSTGMLREPTEGKPRFDLITPLGVEYDQQMLTRWAKHMARGGVKYVDRNWEVASTSEELGRFRESAFRHFMQWYLDCKDGEDHAAAAFFNISGAELVKGRLGE